FDAGAWFSFVLPQGTPATIVQKLHNATVAAMSAPATEERLKEFGSILVAPERRSPEYLQKFIQSEISRIGCLLWMLLGPTLRRPAYGVGRTRVTRPTRGYWKRVEAAPVGGYPLQRAHRRRRGSDFPACLQAPARRHRVESEGLALPLWAVARLAQVQKPGRACGEAGGGEDWEQWR